MAITTLFVAAFVLAAASTPTGAADPLASALGGRLACVAPNATKKTCGALIRYTWRKDGTVEQRAEWLLGADPVLSFGWRSAGEVRSRAVCQLMVSEDVEAVEFLVDGNPVSARVTERARELLFYAWADLIGREVCTSFVANGSSLRMVTTADGRAVPKFSQPMIWVDPNDGYSVKP